MPVMSDEETYNLAVKIARLLQAETQEANLYFLQENLCKIDERLDRIEAKLAEQTSSDIYRSSIDKHFFKHPSQEKFDVAEIIASEISGVSEAEKPCPYEPTGKTCDHCSMCNSRGF